MNTAVIVHMTNHDRVISRLVQNFKLPFFVKRTGMENTGIDPVTSRMLSERSTI